MEITEQEKLDRFNTAVNKRVDIQIDEIMKSAEKEKKAVLEEAENKALTDSENLIQTEIKKIESKYKSKYAQVEQDNKRNVLIHRNELVEKIFSNVEKKILDFKNSDKYEQYLVNCIKNADIDDTTEILINNNDMKYKDVLIKTLGRHCSFKEDNSIEMGGMLIVNGSDLTDKTLDTTLLEERKKFSMNYSFNK